MVKKKSINSFWLPINLWNLNEIFTTESISPISFYAVRGFGNPVNRNEGELENINYLVLFKERVASEIQIEISQELLNKNTLIDTKSGYYEYSKTVFLRKGKFKVFFNTHEKLQEFLSQQFMLLEVKTVNKFKSDSFIVDSTMINTKSRVSYQPKILTEQSEIEPFYDKAYNQIKGIIYGYVIGSLGSLGVNEQGLISDLTKLKNTIGGIHTDVVLSEQYSNFWLNNVQIQINICSKRYINLFEKDSNVFETLNLRLQEVDNLNKMRCEELTKQKSSRYKNDNNIAQSDLEQARIKIYQYECNKNITSLKDEFAQIKQEEKEKGEEKGKTREYYKKGSSEYERKYELKSQIEEFEKNDYEYQLLKANIKLYEDKVRNFQSGDSQFHTSINDQFNRISEQMNEIVKKTKNYFLEKSNKRNDLPDISFKINLQELTNHYFGKNKSYNDFSIQLSETLSSEISIQEIELLKISLNAILSFPQGRLGNYSEENILTLITEIGKHLPDSEAKSSLRDYYAYRTSKSDEFTFPTNPVLANIIVFLMKLQGHNQINKMLIAKNVKHKKIAFMLYGAYIGFANFPKTFTNIIFDSDNLKLQAHIDSYLSVNYLTQH